MDKIPGLGQLELEVLRYFTENGPLSVGEAAAYFAGERGAARTTIQTVMERLRKKKLLERHEAGGMFVYSAAAASKLVPGQMVKDFVARNLGGNISPLVAYLAESEGLTEEEAAILRRLAKQGDPK
jgi:predicted transcriptional regulator